MRKVLLMATVFLAPAATMSLTHAESAKPSVTKIAGDGVQGAEAFPPTFYVKFSQAQFTEFLADPVAEMKSLGHDVSHLTVHVSDSIWSMTEKKWVKTLTQDQASAGVREKLDLPAVKNWVWLCGYEDEMCVCYRVLG